MNFDDDFLPEPYRGMMDGLDGGLCYQNRGVDAERTSRKIMHEITCCDTQAEVDEIMTAETLIIDAIYLDFPEFAKSITDTADDWRRMLSGRPGAPSPAEPGTSPKGIRKMAANPDFKKIVLKDVELLWPKLDQTYRFNPHEQQSEPCPASAQGAAWSVGIKLPLAKAKALREELERHYADCQSRNARLSPYSTVFGMKKIADEDAVQFTAKRNAVTAAGADNTPPRVVGPDLQDLDDKRIWSGSRGSVRMLAFPSTNPQDKSGGITLLLDAVQVTEPVYGSDNLEDDFDAVEVKAPSLDDLPPPQQAAPPQQRAAVPAGDEW